MVVAVMVLAVVPLFDFVDSVAEIVGLEVQAVEVGSVVAEGEVGTRLYSALVQV